MDKKKARRPAKYLELLPKELRTMGKKGVTEARKARPNKRANGHPKGQNQLRHPCTPEIIEKAKAQARKGAPDYMIACILGISAPTMYKWLKESESFKLAIIQGRAEFVDKLGDQEEELLSGKDDGTKHLSSVRQKMAETYHNRLFSEHNKQMFVMYQQQDTTPIETPATQSWKSIKDEMYSVDEEKKKFTSMNNKDLQQ